MTTTTGIIVTNYFSLVDSTIDASMLITRFMILIIVESILAEARRHDLHNHLNKFVAHIDIYW